MSEKVRDSWADGTEQQSRGSEIKEEEGQRIRKKEKAEERQRQEGGREKREK